MKKVMLVAAMVFATSSLVNANTLIKKNFEEDEIRRYRIRVDCDGDGVPDYDMTGNFTHENAKAMAEQMRASC